MERYVIWGMGLLGTSLALDLKKKGAQIIGIEKSLEYIEILKKYGFDNILHTDDPSLITELGKCQGIIIGTPIDQVFPILEQIFSYNLPESIWITDMASTKGELMCKVNAYKKVHQHKVQFIGSHPMAGSDLSGPAHARGDLFVNATIYVTPVPWDSSQGSFSDYTLNENPVQSNVMEFWRKVGARPFEISSQIHDKWAAYLSHGLHLVSCMVSYLLDDISEVYNLESSPAGGSFRDITRVAGSNPKLWDGIINSNSSEVTLYLESLEKLIHEWKVLLSEKKLPVENIFMKSAQIRSAIIKNNSNPIEK